MKRLRTGKLNIGSEIMEIVEIRNNFSQTVPLFRPGTRNECSWRTIYLKTGVVISVIVTQDGPIQLTLQRPNHFKIQNKY